jgi:hypothetical protein
VFGLFSPAEAAQQHAMMTPTVIKDLRAIAALKNEGIFDTPEAKDAKAVVMEAWRARHALLTAAAAAPLAGPLADPSVRAAAAAAKQRPCRTNLSKRMQAATAHARGRARTPATRALELHQHGHGDRASDAAAKAGMSRKRKSAPSRLETDGVALDSEYCAACEAKLDSVVGLAVHARRTVAERKLIKSDQEEWNYARLTTVLVVHVFDPLGNFLVCCACLIRRFAVSHTFVARVHALALQWRLAPVVVLTKQEFETKNLDLARVVAPETWLGSKRAFVKSRQPADSINVTSLAYAHGLVGKPSNRAKNVQLARTLMRAFVRGCRSPTGRTPDANGRPHGALWYLDCK